MKIEKKDLKELASCIIFFGVILLFMTWLLIVSYEDYQNKDPLKIPPFQDFYTEE